VKIPKMKLSGNVEEDRELFDRELIRSRSLPCDERLEKLLSLTLDRSFCTDQQQARLLYEFCEWGKIEQLEPCPFCGNLKPEMFVPSGLVNGLSPDSWFYVQCPGCKAEGPPERNEGCAIDAWNGRASGEGE